MAPKFHKFGHPISYLSMQDLPSIAAVSKFFQQQIYKGVWAVAPFDWELVMQQLHRVANEEGITRALAGSNTACWATKWLSKADFRDLLGINWFNSAMDTCLFFDSVPLLQALMPVRDNTIAAIDVLSVIRAERLYMVVTPDKPWRLVWWRAYNNHVHMKRKRNGTPAGLVLEVSCPKVRKALFRMLRKTERAYITDPKGWGNCEELGKYEIVPRDWAWSRALIYDDYEKAVLVSRG